MKIIKPSFEILKCDDGKEMLKLIEKIGRTCYKSEANISEESYKTFCKMLLSKHHLSVLEHSMITVKFIVDRGISHQIVRHRIASFAQESTRYCNYSKDRFGNEVTFIQPIKIKEGTRAFEIWKKSMEDSERAYFELINEGIDPEIARGVLGASLKTEIVVTMNIRQWIKFFNLRTSKHAHPQIVEVTLPLLNELRERIPIVFDNIKQTE